MEQLLTQVPAFSLTLNVSVLVILLGGLVLLFGKNIADTSPNHYSRMDYQRKGIYFSAKFVLLPLLGAYWLSTVYSSPVPIAYFLIYAVISLYSINIVYNTYFKRYNKKESVEKLLEEKNEEIKTNNQIKSLLGVVEAKTGVEANLEARVDFWTNVLQITLFRFPKLLEKNTVLLFFSGTMLYGAISLVMTSNLLHIVAGLSLLIFGLSSLSYARGYSQTSYPKVIVKTSGENYEGKLLNKGKFFIEILNEDGLSTIPREKAEAIIPQSNHAE